MSDVKSPFLRDAIARGQFHQYSNLEALDAARHAGAELARRSIALVYGGGKVGLMGVLADAVLEGGGHVTGVIPEALIAKEVGHRGLPDLRVVKTMHERKALMAACLATMIWVERVRKFGAVALK